MRTILQSNELSCKLIRQFRLFFDKLINDMQVLVSYSSLLSNLIYEQNNLKSLFLEDWENVVEIGCKVCFMKLKNTRFSILRETVFNLLSNLATDKQIRQKMMEHSKFIKTIIDNIRSFKFLLQKANGQEKIQQQVALESLLALLVNISFEEKTNKLIESGLYQNIQEVMEIYDKENTDLLFSRSFQVLSRVEPMDSEVKLKTLEIAVQFISQEWATKNVTQPTIRFLIRVLTSEYQKQKGRSKQELDMYDSMLDRLLGLLDMKDEQVFCNSCNLCGYILDLQPYNETRSKLFAKFNSRIVGLLQIIKDETGNRRKNSAIFLAKLCKEPSNIQTMRANHGIEILQSVTHLIVKQ